jgi:hypothetical protein
MAPLLKEVKALIEVRRDREYYGTQRIVEGSSRELLFHGILRDTSVQAQAYLEDLKTWVYREAFFDVLVDVREIRAILEVFRDSGAEGLDLDALGAKALDLSSDLASLPLPRDLVSRATVVDRALREEITILL